MSQSRTFHVAVMPGDGIGAEVMDAGLAVLDVVEKRHGLSLKRQTVPGGALHYRATGSALPDASFATAERADAILFGAMGWPEVRYPDGTEVAPQLDLRARLQLFAGVRPIRTIRGVPPTLSSPRAAEIDLVIIRESVEGFFALRDKGEVEDNLARDTMLITREGTQRLSRFAFDLARRRAGQRDRKGRVTIVDKANVFRSFAFMRKVFNETSKEFPDVEADHRYVDAMALDLVRRPWDFDVLPTENFLGDILSDLAAGLIGGMGFAPSADIGDRHAVFQPSHGSAPDIAGTGAANPAAMILSIAMMLEWLGERHGVTPCIDAAGEIKEAVDATFASGIRSRDIGGEACTAEITRAVIANIGPNRGGQGLRTR